MLSEEKGEVLKRFARVFDQAYTRFLDLQKAEAQSREAQIELGLERVRARAMAMQASEELNDQCIGLRHFCFPEFFILFNYFFNHIKIGR